MLWAQIGSAGNHGLESSEQELLGELLSESPRFLEDCRTGTVHADTRILGTDLLALCVILGQTESTEILLNAASAEIPATRLDALLAAALHNADAEMAGLLARHGAMLGPDAAQALIDSGGVDSAQFGELLQALSLGSEPQQWMDSLEILLPALDAGQLARILAAGSHWDYDSPGQQLLESCIAQPGKLMLLLDAGFDLPRYLQSAEQTPLVQLCRAYRKQRMQLELNAVGDAGEVEAAMLSLSRTTADVLQRLHNAKVMRSRSDERLEELEFLTEEEYAVTSPVADMRFYRTLRSLGMNLNATDGDGNNALQLLLVQGLLEDAELLELQQLGVDPLHENFLSRSALHSAILLGRSELATKWLERPLTPQPVALVATGRMAEFEEACAVLELDEKQRLRALEKGMLLAGQSGSRQALQAVIASGEAPLMQALVMLGMESELGKAFFDQKLLINENLSVDSSLTLAVQRGNLDLLEFLFSVLPHDQHWIEEAQDQALMEAVRLDDHRFMLALLDYGTPVEQRRSGGLTPLVSASSAGQLGNMRKLIQLGADPGHALGYMASLGDSGSAGTLDASRRQDVLQVLLGAWNPDRPGLESAWTGEAEPGNSLLVAMAGWQECDEQLMQQVAELSTDAACDAAMLACIDRGRSDLLQAILVARPQLPADGRQAQLVAYCLRRASADCLASLLAMGFGLPDMREAVAIAGLAE